jgi:hypothetical protein
MSSYAGHQTDLLGAVSLANAASHTKSPSLESETHASPLSGYLSKPWEIYIAAAALTVTTTVSTLVLAGCTQERTISPEALAFVTRNRATVQLVVQIVSNILGLLCNTTITVLILYGTRSNLWKRPVELEVLKLWHDLCMRNFLIPLFAFVVLSAAPSAIWAGALTPVVTSVYRTGPILHHLTTIRISSWNIPLRSIRKDPHSGIQKAFLRIPLGF